MLIKRERVSGKVRKMLFFLSSEVADCRAHRVTSTLSIA